MSSPEVPQFSAEELMLIRVFFDRLQRESVSISEFCIEHTINKGLPAFVIGQFIGFHEGMNDLLMGYGKYSEISGDNFAAGKIIGREAVTFAIDKYLYDIQAAQKASK